MEHRHPDQPTPLGPRLVGPSDLIRSVAFSPDGSRLAVTSDDKRVYLYDLRRPGPDRIAVISDDAPVTQAVFADGGQVLVVGARDLSTWNLNGGGRPTQIDRRPEMHVSTLSLAPSRVIVGTATHELLSIAVTTHGRIADPQAVRPLLATTDSTTTWQFPARTTTDDVILTGGDTTGAIYLQTLRVDDARAWICGTTPPLRPAQRQAYLPHTEIGADCSD